MEPTLIEKFEQAIEERQFTPTQIMGFKSVPKLAILAGCVIGYNLALNQVYEIVTCNPHAEGR